jgi:hypothetical protein
VTGSVLIGGRPAPRTWDEKVKDGWAAIPPGATLVYTMGDPRAFVVQRHGVGHDPLPLRYWLGDSWADTLHVMALRELAAVWPEAVAGLSLKLYGYRDALGWRVRA